MNTIASILVYVCVFAASAAIVQYGYKHKSRALQFVGLALPIILGGLRYDVGLDYLSYFDAYADIIDPQVTYRYEATPSLELTFRIIAQISHFLFSSPVPMFLAYCGIIVFAFYSALCLMRPKNVGFALFFFYSIFFLNSFNIMRQGAAMSIGALAIAHYIKGNRRKAFLYIVVATLFHISALLLIVYIAIEHMMEKRYLIRKKIKSFSKLFLMTFILSASIAVVGLSVATIGNYIYEITGRIGEYDMKLSPGVVFKYLLAIACTYAVIFAWKKFDVEQKRLALFVVLGVIIYALGIVHNEAARIGMYLMILTPILAAVTYDYLDLRQFKSKLFLSGGVTCLSALYIVSVHIGGGEGVRYDYQNVITSPGYRRMIQEIGI